MGLWTKRASLRWGLIVVAAQKMKFSIKDFFSKCDQIRNFLRIWSYLLKKSLMKNFIFCKMCVTVDNSIDKAIKNFDIVFGLQ